MFHAEVRLEGKKTSPPLIDCGIILGNDAHFRDEGERQPFIAVMNVNFPKVNTRVQGKPRKFVNEGRRSRIERDVVIDIRPYDGIVNVLEANEVSTLANGLLDSRVNIDNDFARWAIQVQNVGLNFPHQPAGKRDRIPSFSRAGGSVQAGSFVLINEVFGRTVGA